jgi:predicted  nucleic acid-binding Zn-ribbon protein
VNSLSQSAQELKSEESQALRPEIDSLKAAITNLTNATSLSDLQAGFNSLKTQAQSITDQISETLKCS